MNEEEQPVQSPAKPASHGWLTLAALGLGAMALLTLLWHPLSGGRILASLFIGVVWMVVALRVRRSPGAVFPQMLMTMVIVGGCHMVGYWGPPDERIVSMVQAMLLALATGVALFSAFRGRIPNGVQGLKTDAAKGS